MFLYNKHYIIFFILYKFNNLPTHIWEQWASIGEHDYELIYLKCWLLEIKLDNGQFGQR